MTQYDIDLAVSGIRPVIVVGIFLFLSIPGVFLFIWGIDNVFHEKTLGSKLYSLGISLVGFAFALTCWGGAWYQQLPKGGAR